MRRMTLWTRTLVLFGTMTALVIATAAMPLAAMAMVGGGGGGP
jgi:hypothetical protein